MVKRWTVPLSREMMQFHVATVPVDQERDSSTFCIELILQL